MIAQLAVAFQPDWWEVMRSPFMRNALVAGTIVAVVAGLLGYLVVVRSSAFAAHALAHIGFPGATGAVLIGVPVSLGLTVFCIAGGLVIGVLGRRASEREVVTGTVLAFATGLGILFASLSTRGSGVVTNVLFGNLLGVSADQLWVFGGLAVLIVAVVAVTLRPLLFASVDPEVAQARGLPVRLLGTVFMVLLALVVAMAVQVVGTLLLFALVVTPAATAITWTPHPYRAIGAAIGVALASAWLGLTASAMLNLPPSFFIVTIACAVWFVTWLAARRTRRVGERVRTPDAHHA